MIKTTDYIKELYFELDTKSDLEELDSKWMHNDTVTYNFTNNTIYCKDAIENYTTVLKRMISLMVSIYHMIIHRIRLYECFYVY